MTAAGVEFSPNDPCCCSASFILNPKCCIHIALCDSPVGLNDERLNDIALNCVFFHKWSFYRVEIQQDSYALGYEAVKPPAGAESESVQLNESFLLREGYPHWWRRIISGFNYFFLCSGPPFPSDYLLPMWSFIKALHKWVLIYFIASFIYMQMFCALSKQMWRGDQNDRSRLQHRRYLL